MTHLVVLAKEITTIYQRNMGPFPYSGCWKVIDHNGATVGDLAPDLNWFLSTVCGYASNAERLVNMSYEESGIMQESRHCSFFNEYPQYKVAEQFITAENTADLFVELQEAEMMRLKLLLFAEMKRSQQEASS